MVFVWVSISVCGEERERGEGEDRRRELIRGGYGLIVVKINRSTQWVDEKSLSPQLVKDTKTWAQLYA